jgi:hypothetical protein
MVRRAHHEEIGVPVRVAKPILVLSLSKDTTPGGLMVRRAHHEEIGVAACIAKRVLILSLSKDAARRPHGSTGSP